VHARATSTTEPNQSPALHGRISYARGCPEVPSTQIVRLVYPSQTKLSAQPGREICRPVPCYSIRAAVCARWLSASCQQKAKRRISFAGPRGRHSQTIRPASRPGRDRYAGQFRATPRLDKPGERGYGENIVLYNFIGYCFSLVMWL
jgi:hypothetical protein